MVTALAQISLEAFLASPNIDESPAWELINLVAVQKPRPTLFHSRLQKRLLAIIDPSTQRYEALPELRCVLATGSVVPDVTVILKEDLPPMNQAIEGAPNWILKFCRQINGPLGSSLRFRRAWMWGLCWPG